MKEEDYKKLRNNYHPKNFGKDLEVVFIFESPPASGKCFYNTAGDKNENLYRDTMKCFSGRKFLTKTAGLNWFANDGYLIVDASYKPINELTNNDRQQIIFENRFNLMTDLENLSIDSNPYIIVVTKNVYDSIYQFLLSKNFNIINDYRFVNYNGNWQQTKFRKIIKEIFNKHHITKKIYDNYIC